MVYFRWEIIYGLLKGEQYGRTGRTVITTRTSSVIDLRKTTPYDKIVSDESEAERERERKRKRAQEEKDILVRNFGILSMGFLMVDFTTPISNNQIRTVEKPIDRSVVLTRCRRTQEWSRIEISVD